MVRSGFLSQNLLLSFLLLFSSGVAAVHPSSLCAAIPEKALKIHMDQVKKRLSAVSIAPDANRVGVLNLGGDTGNLVRDKLEASLIETGKFEAIARDQLDKLIKEIEFQEGAEVDGKTVKELKLKGVDYLVTGSVSVSRAGAGTSVRLNIKITNCSTGGRKFVYNEEVLVSMDDFLTRLTRTMGPATIIILGFVLVVILVILFRLFGGARAVASNTIFATVRDYMTSDKKIRENAALELRQIKNRIKDAAASCDKNEQPDLATSLNAVAGEVDLLSQLVAGAPFGQDLAQARAIPRDVAERLKAADLAFTDRVSDFGRNASRVKDLASEKRFDGLESDVDRLKTEVAALKDKFEERGRILRSF